MATTTLYGGAPLPPLAPAADRLEASRGATGGWNAQHRTTRRTALGVALALERRRSTTSPSASPPLPPPPQRSSGSLPASNFRSPAGHDPNR